MDNKVTMEITNERLEQCIKECMEQKTDEKLQEVLNMMRTTMLLVPAMLVAPNQPQPCFLQNDKGEMFLAVFTSKKQIPQKPASQAILSMPFPECNRLVATVEQKLVGMVINPFTDSLVLKRELVMRLHEADKNGPQLKQIKMSQEQFQVFVKSQVEFAVLPKRLFVEGAEFVNRIFAERENLIGQIFAENYKQPNLNPFTAKDYEVMPLNIAPDLKLVRIDFPEKGIVAPLCYRAYITYDPIANKAGYYTIEKAPQDKGVDCILGGVNEKGQHIIYGEAPKEGTELDHIIMLARKVDEITS